MYVRIKHDDIEDLYECGRVNLRPHEEQVNAVLVDMEGVPQLGQIAHIVKKGRDELYLMNDDGQTIDSYVWADIDLSND